MGKASNLARHVAAVKNSEVPEIIAFRKMMKKAF
jgi:hypothetical protein